MDGHRERCESGAGIAWHDGSGFRAVKDLGHDKMYAKYERMNSRMASPVTIFHSRMPSEGSVCMENVQPFITPAQAFCHNGTIALEKLVLANLAKGTSLAGYESDSNLLFTLIKGQPMGSIVMALKELDQNFIFANAQGSSRQIYVFGHFLCDYASPGDPAKVLSLKNDWSTERIFMVTDFHGIVQYFEKFPTHYRYQDTWGKGRIYETEGEFPLTVVRKAKGDTHEKRNRI